MKNYTITLIITLIGINQCIIGMEAQETQLTVVGPIARQSSGTTTTISIAADPQSPTEAHTNTFKRITHQTHRVRTPCPTDTSQACKYVVIAGIIALIVFSFVPLPHHT